MSAALAAARLGDRITHGAAVAEHAAGALVSVVTGALVSAAGAAGAATATLGAGLGCGGGRGITTADVIPFAVSGAVLAGSPTLLIGAARMPVALATAAPLECAIHHGNIVRTGSASVSVGGMGLARQTDQTACGAIVSDGDKTVLVGGAPSDAAPSNPLAAIAHGAACASAGIGAALADGAEALDRAMSWGEAIADRALDAVEKAETRAEAAVGAIAAQAGAILGEATSALGTLLGTKL
jgi:uncharacterized Zn-binding protein involved in type VI secretion